ncbi:STAS/SEC14 domain-containing protein [Endozoicomonas lisbonensis]|uniref:STAS/SEC14 domain-containing protein n=1 Tax=Endozoicomonas lisbonensis TaxID=3120522 RepID=A0ABV2SK15_9GAMM
MNTTKHGISINIENIEDESILVLNVFGKLTHSDYESFTPALESAINQAPDSTVKLLVDISDLQGWELRAFWDDCKMGLKHNKDFKQIALLSNKNWQDIAAKVGNWFLAGELKSFGNKDDALNWLSQGT